MLECNVQWKSVHLWELTESGSILNFVRFVKPVNFEWRDTSQSVYRYALLRVDIKVDY